MVAEPDARSEGEVEGVVALQNTAAEYEPTFDAFKIAPADKQK